MNLRLYGLASDSIVDGPGLRLAIFFQGCLKRCEGCHNPDSWWFHGGDKWDTEELKKQIDEDGLIDGITLSGGEPFLQPLAAKEIAQYAHSKGLTVWCYTGYTFEELLESEDDARLGLLKDVDVLVDGPFVKEQASMELKWRGSANQRLIDVKKSLKKGEVLLYDWE